MATIKSYSDLQQSKVLSKILPLESADMYYSHEFVNSAGDYYRLNIASEGYFDDEESLGSDIPAWSLAALFNVIPQEIFDGEYIINITEGCDNRWVLTYDHYENRNHSYFGLATGADNLVDACYEMILKLHELNLL